MRNEVKNIVIVGGGSAGWMTASMLRNQLSDMNITLIESPNVPTVGVGESTVTGINQFLRLLGLKDEDWMPFCNASYKFGVRFQDFYKKGHNFHYPFGTKDLTNTTNGISDWFLKKTLNPNVSHQDFANSFYACMPFIRENKIPEVDIPQYNPNKDKAYQMDATLFGQYLKEKYCIPNNVKYVQQHIKNIPLDEEGYISCLELENGEKLYADLFVDCSGFRSLLLEKTLGVGYNSFKDVLPNNKAWATRIEYTDQEKEMVVVTNCTGLDNGWVWNVPLMNRMGTGYVFSDMFTTDEEALQEFKNYLDSDQMIVHNPNRSKDLKFNLVEIRNGVHDKCWFKNCVAIGLSYAFLEPLESTGLFLIQESILKLCQTLHLKQINKIHVDSFNYIMKEILNTWKTFVSYHFVLSSRRDTKYWRYLTEEVDMNIIHRTDTGDYAAKMLQTHDMRDDVTSGIPDIFVGMDYIPFNKTQIALFEDSMMAESNEKGVVSIDPLTEIYWEKRYKKNASIAQTSKSHYKYLINNVYK